MILFIPETLREIGKRFDKSTSKPKRIQKRPLLLVRPMFLALFYTKIRELAQLTMTVMYYDYNTRLLAFGEEQKKDYLMVLRSKQDNE